MCMFEVFWFSILTISGRRKSVYPSVSSSSLSLLLIRFRVCFIRTVIIYRPSLCEYTAPGIALQGYPTSSLFLCLTNVPLCLFLFPGFCCCTVAVYNIAKRGNIFKKKKKEKKKKRGQSSDVYVYVHSQGELYFTVI